MSATRRRMRAHRARAAVRVELIRAAAPEQEPQVLQVLPELAEAAAQARSQRGAARLDRARVREVRAPGHRLPALQVPRLERVLAARAVLATRATLE